jgi:cytoskeleton protein RodZ
MHMNHPVIPPSSADQALGVYLSFLRVGAGLDTVVLARRVSLSPAQVAQLESGRSSLFYNHRIRLQAARKIILHLGGDLAKLPDYAPQTLPVLPVSGSAVTHLSEAAKPVAPQPTQPVRPAASSAATAQPRALPTRHLATALGLGAVLLGLGILAGTPWSPAVFPTVAHPSETDPLHRRCGQTWVRLRQRLKGGHAPVDLKPMEVAAAVLPAGPLETLAAPVGDKSASKPVDDLLACAWPSGAAPSFQPQQARKPGDMVYVVSEVSQVLCVADADGKSQSKRLEAGQAQSYYGRPPWQLMSSALQQTQVYFQGYKVRFPSQTQDRVELVELH